MIEILLQVALNTINQTKPNKIKYHIDTSGRQCTILIVNFLYIFRSQSNANSHSCTGCFDLDFYVQSL